MTGRRFSSISPLYFDEDASSLSSTPTKHLYFDEEISSLNSSPVSESEAPEHQHEADYILPQPASPKSRSRSPPPRRSILDSQIVYSSVPVRTETLETSITELAQLAIPPILGVPPPLELQDFKALTPIPFGCPNKIKGREELMSRLVQQQSSCQSHTALPRLSKAYRESVWSSAFTSAQAHSSYKSYSECDASSLPNTSKSRRSEKRVSFQSRSQRTSQGESSIFSEQSSCNSTVRLSNSAECVDVWGKSISDSRRDSRLSFSEKRDDSFDYSNTSSFVQNINQHVIYNSEEISYSPKRRRLHISDVNHQEFTSETPNVKDNFNNYDAKTPSTELDLSPDEYKNRHSVYYEILPRTVREQEPSTFQMGIDEKFETYDNSSSPASTLVDFSEDDFHAAVPIHRTSNAEESPLSRHSMASKESTQFSKLGFYNKANDYDYVKPLQREQMEDQISPVYNLTPEIPQLQSSPASQNWNESAKDVDILCENDFQSEPTVFGNEMELGLQETEEHALNAFGETSVENHMIACEGNDMITPESHGFQTEMIKNDDIPAAIKPPKPIKSTSRVRHGRASKKGNIKTELITTCVDRTNNAVQGHCRYPRRTRIPPLKWYIGERQEFQMNPKLRLPEVVSLKKCINADEVLHHLIGNLKSGRSIRKTPSLTTKSLLQLEDQGLPTGEILETRQFDQPENIDTNSISEVTRLPVTYTMNGTSFSYNCVVDPHELHWAQVSAGSGPNSVIQVACGGRTPQIKVCSMRIPPQHRKQLDSTKSNMFYGYVMQGKKLLVQVDGHDRSAEVGDMFVIPQHSDWVLENCAKNGPDAEIWLNLVQTDESSA